MNDVPENELFSAYLDGELTAAEQADVERLLARSPAARQLLDDLRALSSNLQTLPQYKLDEDLSEHVIRAAERQILTRSERLTKPAAQRPSLPRPSLLRRLIESRALVWSGLAVAVAVIFMMMEPQGDRPAGDGGLAVAPDTPDETDTPDEDKFGLGPEPTIGSRESKPAGSKRDEGGGRRGNDDGRNAKTGKAPGHKAKTQRGGVALENIARPEARIVANKPGGMDGPAKDAGPVTLGIPDGGGGGQITLPPKTDLAANAPGESITGGFADETGTMVVHCDISFEAARDEVFVRLLTTNGIALTDVNGMADAKDLFRDAMTERLTEVQAARPHGHFQKKPAGKIAESQRDGRTRDAKLVYTVTSREQIEGVLSSLSDDEDAVLSLSVDPDPDTPEQKSLERYNRSIATHRPVRSTEEQSAIQFGVGTQDAAGQSQSKATGRRRSGGDEYKGGATGQAWRIDKVETREKLEPLVRRGDRRGGRQDAAEQADFAPRSGEPLAGQTSGGRAPLVIGKGYAGQAPAEPASRPAGEPARKKEGFKDAQKALAADPAPADADAPTQPAAPDSPGDQPQRTPLNPPPPVAPTLKAESGKRKAESKDVPPPTATQPGQTAEPLIQPPDVDADRPSSVAETQSAKSPDNAEKEEGVGAKGPGQGRSQAATQRPRPGKQQPRIELQEKLEPLWQELDGTEVVKYRTLFVLRIVGTASPPAAAARSGINEPTEAAAEPPAVDAKR